MTNLGQNNRRLAYTAVALAASIANEGTEAFQILWTQQVREIPSSPTIDRASFGFGLLGSSAGKTTPQASEPRWTEAALAMAAGRGMGMASPIDSKKVGRKKKGGGGIGGGGMGMGGGGGKSKKNKRKSGELSAAPFDVSAALLRSERLYEEIVGDAAKEIAESDDDAYNFDSITTEYIIAARSAKADAAAMSDWVPVAQLVTVRPVSDYSSSSHDDTEHRESIRMAVSANCRELHHAATIAAPVFKSLPRNDVQYGCEPIDSFYRFVYDDVIEGKTPGAASSSESRNGAGGEDGDGAMTKSRARTVLDLEDGCSDMAVIKRAYRDKSFQLHPDRFVGEDRTEEERRDASRDFALVKTAYEVLCSGVRSKGSNNSSGGRGQSWYESLGGRQRTEFYAPVELVSISKAQKTIDGLGGKTAVVGLDYDIVMSFVVRNQAAAAAT